MRHLAGALGHEQARAARGPAHFAARWEEGRELQASLGRACRAAGLKPRAVILDDDLGESLEVAVDLLRPLPAAERVLLNVREFCLHVGSGAWRSPPARGKAEFRPGLAIGSLLAVLEAGDAAKGVIHILRSQGWTAPVLWTPEEITRTLARLIEFLGSAAFRRLLGRTLGARRGAQCYARFMPRLIPGLCRRLLLAQVLWLMYEALGAPARPASGSLQSPDVGPGRTLPVARPVPCAFLL